MSTADVVVLVGGAATILGFVSMLVSALYAAVV